MAGLVPAIHVEQQQTFASSKCGIGPTWVTGTSPAMTELLAISLIHLEERCVNAIADWGGEGGEYRTKCLTSTLSLFLITAR
jgi:hypothetical protein